MNPLLTSIIIPCYNAQCYIGDAIQSALDQTYDNFEVIVVDDGSTDDSLQVIQGFGDRVRWATGRNRGGCAARNRGLEIARGELIQFLDSDDLLSPEKLIRQVPIAIEHRNSITYSDYEARDIETDEFLAIHSRESRGHDTVEFVLGSQRLQTSSPLHWRSQLLQVGGFREDLVCAQEFELHLRLACAGLEFIHLPEVLHVVRRRTGSVSSDSLRVIDQHEKICLDAYHDLKGSGRLNEARAASLAGLLASGARVYIRHGLNDRAAQYFKTAAMMHPNGGLDKAYSPPVRWIRRMVGPRILEKFVGFKRQISGQAKAQWQTSWYPIARRPETEAKASELLG